MSHEGLLAIDTQIQHLWACYRKWHAKGVGGDVTPQDALLEIDVLLEQRHDMAASMGELRNPLDIAQASEWGEADTGQGQAA